MPAASLGLRKFALTLSVCATFATVWGQLPILPLKEVTVGMKGTGRTVFSGTQVEEFQVEILGVMENIGPRQSVILGKLTGGPLDKTGVMQGMSGSPVYIGGRLIGAVALSFPFAKDAIAGIRPIEEMLSSAGPRRDIRPIAMVPGELPDLAARLPRVSEVSAGGAKLVEIATPVWLSGFTRGTLEHYAPSLRAAGLELMQGAGGGKAKPAIGVPAKPEPGSMISVQMMTGDLNVGADGTVTHVDGNRVYAFGHRFLSIGDTEMPFARSSVLTLLANQNISFKISTPQEWLGTILQDRNTAIAGELGRKAQLTPVEMRLRNAKAGIDSTYRMEMVNDHLFAPILLQMAVFSALDATERTVGEGTVTVKGTLEWSSGPPVRIESVYTGEFAIPQQAAAAAAVPLAYVLQGNTESLQLKRVSIDLDVADRKEQWQIEGVVASPRDVRPGETMDIVVNLSGPDGAEKTQRLQYAVPVGAPLGTLYVTASDALTANLTDYRQFLFTPPRNAAQMVGYLNGLRSNSKAFVRVWRGHMAYQVQGESLPSPPPSAVLLLGRAATGTAVAHTKVAEFEIPAPSGAVSGSKTVMVEVKE